MENNIGLGAVQVAGGGYIAYKGIEHGLPRALGLRIEYHTTSKQNAKLIKKVGNILDPKFGGKGGWSETVKDISYINNSKNFIHITGVHPNDDALKDTTKRFCKKLPKSIRSISEKVVSTTLRPIQRKFQCIMYKTVGNMKGSTLLTDNPGSKKDIVKEIGKVLYRSVFKNDTKRFCIPGIDSYFRDEFIADCDDIAMKSSKKLHAYSNRFSAMLAGLKKFGLKGIKENKSRVAVGIAALSLSLYAAGKIIKKGISNIIGSEKKQPVEAEKLIK